jgi:plastocyanin
MVEVSSSFMNCGSKKSSILIFAIVVAGCWSAVLPASAQVNVTQEHNNLSRDGVYIDPAFTPSNAANLTRDLNFDGTISGHVYAQPLYIEGGLNGPMVIAVTESNNVYALRADTGTIIWQRNLGTPAPTGACPGNISPVGITGTPVVDLNSRSLFLDAVINDNPPNKHFIYSLNVDTGVTNPNWPVNVDNAVPGFSSAIQEERGALALVDGIVYVAYSAYVGDCGNYHGWVVGVDINNPSSVGAWATTAIGGGIWGHGGVASDGTSMFVVTGNTFTMPGDPWSGGEAIVRLSARPMFSDFWAPPNWQTLDVLDQDLGGVSATVIDVPGATPSELVLALGKDTIAYLVDRNNLGGVAPPVAQADVSGTVNRGTSAVTYHTSQGTYFAFHNDGAAISAYRITATSPPTIQFAWSVTQSGRGSPWVTATDDTNNVIVWVAGVEGDQRLHAYDGDTGAVVYAGGGASELMTGTRQWNTGIAARGRIYFAADNRVYAFRLPGGTPTPTPTVTVTPSVTPTGTPTSTPRPTPTPRGSITPRPRPTPLPRPSAAAATKPLRIIDQDGHEAVSGVPSTFSSIFDVSVGPGLAFVPDTVNISAGDTVRWTWKGNGHSVTSGDPCTPDGQFCSPDNMNCDQGILSNTGAVYEHTFAQPGTYSYFCFAHCSFGMTGTVNVAPSIRRTPRPRPTPLPRPTPR